MLFPQNLEFTHAKLLHCDHRIFGSVNHNVWSVNLDHLVDFNCPQNNRQSNVLQVQHPLRHMEISIPLRSGHVGGINLCQSLNCHKTLLFEHQKLRNSRNLNKQNLLHDYKNVRHLQRL